MPVGGHPWRRWTGRKASDWLAGGPVLDLAEEGREQRNFAGSSRCITPRGGDGALGGCATVEGGGRTNDQTGGQDRSGLARHGLEEEAGRHKTGKCWLGARKKSAKMGHKSGVSEAERWHVGRAHAKEAGGWVYRTEETGRHGRTRVHEWQKSQGRRERGQV